MAGKKKAKQAGRRKSAAEGCQRPSVAAAAAAASPAPTRSRTSAEAAAVAAAAAAAIAPSVAGTVARTSARRNSSVTGGAAEIAAAVIEGSHSSTVSVPSTDVGRPSAGTAGACRTAETDTALSVDFDKLTTGRSAESEQRRDGYTAAGDKLQTCSCSDSLKCRGIMWQWSELGEDYRHMVDYAWIPKKRKKAHTLLAQHINEYHDGCLLHLLGRGDVASKAKEELSSKAGSLPVAIHHFKECLREGVMNAKETKGGMIDKYRCSLEEGKQAGLTRNDLCSIAGSGGGTATYFAYPTNINFSDIEHELNQAKKKSALKLNAETQNASGKKKPPPANDEFTTPAKNGAAAPTQAGSFGRRIASDSGASVTFAPRRSPEERSFEQRIREIAANPARFALEFEEMQKKLDASQKAYEEMKEGREQDKEAYEKQIKKMQEEFELQMKSTGMNRKSLLNDEWHKKYHWMANFLFGFEKWAYFKAFVEHAFVDCDIDINVTGDERHITKLEKVCMVAMVARRAFRRPYFSGIYGRTTKAITGYLKEWVPISAKIGHCLSELPLEKTHNFFVEEMAKEYKTPYILSDGTVNDYEEDDDNEDV